VAGEIAVGAYVTEAALDKLMRYRRGLVGAMFKEQPPVTLQVIRGRLHNFPYCAQSVGA
jgi:hypothetical protein